MEGNFGRRMVKAAISAANTIVLKTRAVTKVLVDAVVSAMVLDLHVGVNGVARQGQIDMVRTLLLMSKQRGRARSAEEMEEGGG